jgi:hypothetical protein
MYWGSSSRLGSLLMPLRLSSLTWYWSITRSGALRSASQTSLARAGPAEAYRTSTAYACKLRPLPPPCPSAHAPLSKVR